MTTYTVPEAYEWVCDTCGKTVKFGTEHYCYSSNNLVGTYPYPKQKDTQEKILDTLSEILKILKTIEYNTR